MPRPRALAQSLVGASSVGWLSKLPLWRGVLVLGYHRIQEDPENATFDSGVFSATPSTLDDHLQFITRHFEVVSVEAIERDPGGLGRRVVVTFDDGYRDNYELAFPLLRRHGVPATFFLATGFLDHPGVAWWDDLAWIVKHSQARALQAGAWLRGPLSLEGDHGAASAELARVYKSLPTKDTEAFLDFCAEAAGTGRCPAAAGADLWMTWEMAAEMRDAGMVIGGHTVTHPVLARADDEVQRWEIETCARRLREELGMSMRYFAYPIGLPDAFNDSTRRILHAVGVKLAFSLYGGYLRRDRLDSYDVPRTSIGIGIGTDRSAFRAALAVPKLFARW